MDDGGGPASKPTFSLLQAADGLLVAWAPGFVCWATAPTSPMFARTLQQQKDLLATDGFRGLPRVLGAVPISVPTSSGWPRSVLPVCPSPPGSSQSVVLAIAASLLLPRSALGSNWMSANFTNNKNVEHGSFRLQNLLKHVTWRLAGDVWAAMQTASEWRMAAKP